MGSLIFPPYLQEGDRVIVLSPSSKIDKSFLKGAYKRLKSWGLEVVFAKHAGSSNGTYAGNIRQRLEDLQEAMDDEEAKVIFCSRGGYGAVHLIGKLDFTKFRQHPKWLIGFSDITALHNLFQQNGFASLHAPMARHLTVEPEDDFCTQALKDILFGQALGGTEAFSYVCPGHKLNHKGEGKGVLRGGNLSVFYGLRGTPYDIPAEGTILFIEDVGERPACGGTHDVQSQTGRCPRQAFRPHHRTIHRIRGEQVLGKRPIWRIGRFGERIRLPDMFRFSRRTCQHECTADKRCCGNIGSWKERSETKF